MVRLTLNMSSIKNVLARNYSNSQKTHCTLSDSERKLDKDIPPTLHFQQNNAEIHLEIHELVFSWFNQTLLHKIAISFHKFVCYIQPSFTELAIHFPLLLYHWFAIKITIIQGTQIVLTE